MKENQIKEMKKQEIKNQVTKRRKSLKEKGITLVALVVTIVILLILTGVTLNLALSDNGLFEKTREAVEKYEEAEEEEENLITKLKEQLDMKNLTVGDKVNYNPDKVSNYELKSELSGNTINQTIPQEEYTWKILSINSDGSVNIIGIPTPDMTTVYLKGSTGYNNGVYLLNEICKELYSNEELGVESRSINIEDIESKMNTIGKDRRDAYISLDYEIQYGHTKEYNNNTYYPKLAKYENHIEIDNAEVNLNGIKESEDGTSLKDNEIKIPLEETDTTNYTNSKLEGKNIKVKQTYYNLEQTSEYYADKNFYNLVFQTDVSYWLASRYSDCVDGNSGDQGSKGACFGIRVVKSKTISGRPLFYSNNYDCLQIYKLCPIVTLGSDIKLTRDDDNSEWTPSKIDTPS